MKLLLNTAITPLSSVFNFSENENLRCNEAILHFFSVSHFPHVIARNLLCMAPDQILPIPVLIYSRAYVLHMPPSLVVTQRCCQKKVLAEGTGDTHYTRCHPTCPSLLGLRPQVVFKAKLISFWKKHLARWQLHRSYLGRLRVSPAFITWFWYWKGSWHFNVPVSGHEECEKAEVCLHLQSLFEICKAENNFFPYLENNSSDLCHTCILEWFFNCLILISTYLLFMPERNITGDYRDVALKNIHWEN